MTNDNNLSSKNISVSSSSQDGHEKVSHWGKLVPRELHSSPLRLSNTFIDHLTLFPWSFYSFYSLPDAHFFSNLQTP